jgi:hypothetical protein
MKNVSVVLLQRDATRAWLASALSLRFAAVHIARSPEELEDYLVIGTARIAIIDLETVDLMRINTLSRDFPDIRFVGTHRLADEAMWVRGLQMGAAEVCFPDDIPGIVDAATREAVVRRALVA